MQLKALRHIYKDYTSSYEMLRETYNRPRLLIDIRKVMLLEVKSKNISRDTIFHNLIP